LPDIRSGCRGRFASHTLGAQMLRLLWIITPIAFSALPLLARMMSVLVVTEPSLPYIDATDLTGMSVTLCACAVVAGLRTLRRSETTEVVLLFGAVGVALMGAVLLGMLYVSAATGTSAQLASGFALGIASFLLVASVAISVGVSLFAEVPTLENPQ
jgi:hypothetical protein